MHTARSRRIVRDWLALMATSRSWLLEALDRVGPDMPAAQAIALANVESSAALPPADERGFREGLAELLTIPAPARVLFLGYGEHLRPHLALSLARRDARERPAMADYAAADVQLIIIDEWARRSRRVGFRRRGPDVLREIARDLSVGAPISPRGSPQIAGRVLLTPWQVPRNVELPACAEACEGRGVESVQEYRQRRRDTIARNIRRMLDDQDRSAYWLARQIGVTDARMSEYLHAKHEPLNYVDELAAALRCSVDDLYRQNGGA